jgi:hypothetical protein
MPCITNIYRSAYMYIRKTVVRNILTIIFLKLITLIQVYRSLTPPKTWENINVPLYVLCILGIENLACNALSDIVTLAFQPFDALFLKIHFYFIAWWWKFHIIRSNHFFLINHQDKTYGVTSNLVWFPVASAYKCYLKWWFEQHH